MEITKRTMLHMLEDAGGITTEYPFIEFGYGDILFELLRDGLVAKIPRQGDLAEIRITLRGQELLSAPENFT